MADDFTSSDEQYICDECGYTSPVANERCPDCGSPMSALHAEKTKTKVAAGDGDEDLSDDTGIDDGSSSLEDLQKQEQEESDKEYAADSFGDE